VPHLDQKSPRLADIELAAGGRTKQGYATVKGRLSVRGLKHMQGSVISMLGCQDKQEGYKWATLLYP